MRSYGIVRTRFWPWAKEKGISPAARELALYCLTCEHTNGTGCFRLPVAYIAEDLGTVPATVRDTLSELARAGFLQHDDATGYVWLPGFLDHNPIANSNVGKSLVPFVEAVPRRVPFYSAFLDSLESSAARFPDGFLTRLRNGIGNGMPNGSANGMPTHEHEHEHEHEQEHEQEHDHDAGARPDDDAEVDAAFATWKAAATRFGWPLLRKVDADRRAKMRARLKDNGGIEGLKEALEAAAASDFVREQMGFNLGWLLKPANWTKLIEGNYRNDRRRRPVERGKVDTLADVVGMFRDREQSQVN